jgi:hypothetical protein
MSADVERASASARRPRALRAIVGACIGLVCAVAGLAYILFAPLPGTASVAVARPLGRGIVDYRLEQAGVDTAQIPTLVAEVADPDKLGASWTRVLVHWSALQPTEPTGSEVSDAERYDAAYLARLDAIMGALSAKGVSVVLTPLDVPRWASDRSLWSSPPPGYKADTYYSFYAPDVEDATVGAQFKKLGQFLAERYSAAAYAGKVRYFECWNEPNQGTYLYPQRPVSATNGGAAVYLKMLKLWAAGVRAGDPDAVVIAGATAPRGRGDAVSTPPQAFARYLKEHGATAYMDAYSHHPYTPGGSTRVQPGQMPNNPDRCVTLGNLSRLTSLFPTKPFYLTEYGYNTQYTIWFGVTVSPADQARYLREAYAYTASRYKQVKALLWFLVDDMPAPAGSSAQYGVYMGVRTADGVRKPSWYAFAGGNKLTLTAPASTKAGARFTVSGVLTHKPAAGDAAETLTLQARTSSGAAWKKVASVKTDPATGAFSRTVQQSRTKLYRVVWGGVCESPARTVKTR